MYNYILEDTGADNLNHIRTYFCGTGYISLSHLFKTQSAKHYKDLLSLPEYLSKVRFV